MTSSDLEIRESALNLDQLIGWDLLRRRTYAGSMLLVKFHIFILQMPYSFQGKKRQQSALQFYSDRPHFGFRNGFMHIKIQKHSTRVFCKKFYLFF